MYDAFWLARLPRFGILAKGDIDPKEWRQVRDLLGKRGHLIRLRTSLINSQQGILSRNCGCSLPGKKIKQVRKSRGSKFFKYGATSKERLYCAGEAKCSYEFVMV